MNNDPFSGFRPPDLPLDLHAPVLRAARTAFARSGAPDAWSRIVNSRAARLVWAASVVLLAAVHFALPTRPTERSASTIAAPRLDPEVGAIARLPRVNEQALATCSGENS
jgi:hypothetical protein